MKLITMTDFVLEQDKPFESTDLMDFLQIRQLQLIKIESYAKFLKQSLKLEMFVICDDEGNILEKPCGYNNFLEYGHNDFMNSYECEQYRQAKEKVLFEGAKINRYENNIPYKSITIDLVIKGHDHIIARSKDGINWKLYYSNVEELINSEDYEGITITKTAKNQLGL